MTIYLLAAHTGGGGGESASYGRNFFLKAQNLLNMTIVVLLFIRLELKYNNAILLYL